MDDTELLKKLSAVTNQLLDLGKRNRLLNFKDSGFKTLQALNKNVEEIFRAVKGGRDVSVLNVDTILADYNRDNNITTNVLDYEASKVYEIARRHLQTRQLLCYKKGNPLIKVLKALQKDYKTSIIEKGINSLYLAFLFVHYYEEEEEYVAPLLLLPIELNVDSNGAVIHQYEDEIILNPTLKYYFNSVYNIDLVPYNEETLSNYILKTKEILPDNIILEEAVSIGVFSFYKMNMYNDLIFNKEKVIQNRNIRLLLGEEQREVDGDTSSPILPVVNCDSSQLDAITLAAQGKSFCLQGPPGSGKSQTITNIIASLLGNGKKILFVSEKISALNVVYENLRRVHLSDFAIELHSNKANKKDFISRLYQAAIKPKYDMDIKSQFLEVKYKALKYSLAQYEKEIATIRSDLGMNLLEVYSLYFNNNENPLDVDLNVDGLNMFDLEKIKTSLSLYSNYSNTLGIDYRKSDLLYLDINSEITKLELTKGIELLTKLLEYKNHFKVINKEYNTINDIVNTLIVLNKAKELKTFSPYYFVKKTRNKIIDSIEQISIISNRLQNPILKEYNDSIYNLDLIDILKKLEVEIQNNKGIFKSKALKEITNTLNSCRNTKVKEDVLLSDLKVLVTVKQNKTLLKEHIDILKKFNIDLKSNLKEMLLELKALDNIPDLIISLDAFNYLKNINTTIDNKFKENLIYLNKAIKSIDSSKLLLMNLSLEELLSILNNINLNIDNRVIYQDVMKVIDVLKNYQILEFLHKYLDYKLDLDYIDKVFEKTFFALKIKLYFSESNILNDFDIEKKDEEVADFRALDERILEINRDLIISRVSKERPNINRVEGSKFKILEHEYNKLRRQIAIRALLDQTFDFVLDIKPVFLMSPLSVSTYLASKENLFDCIIFDEASQIFASDALGSIYRGLQCIIIGDTKQMPPSNFFQANLDEDLEYDLESILDKATNVFPTSSLKFHYRSRSEELIQFSNGSFYDGNLITIPQAKEHEKGFGIDFYYYPEGRYDMTTRTNLYEAEQICKMVIDHYYNSHKSLGVVAFSNVQADLISSLIDKELKKHPKLKKFFDNSTDEPFFVKNLETVQGDERDRIIFSICYAYNQEGKFYQRFGPLNNSGGERRLNVAITRAKFNVSIVSSIKYSDIKESTTSKGALLLRDYLHFAENISTIKNYDDKSDNGVVNDVKRYIESLGYEVCTNYGASSFKVDLAVKKKNSDQFLLAVMLDNMSSYSTNLTDKYRLERLLLKRLGWKYFKIYTTSWVNQPELEKELLQKALENEDEEEVESQYSSSSYLKELQTDEEYNPFSVYEYYGVNRIRKAIEEEDLEYAIAQIIKFEAPIHKDYLYDHIKEAYNKKNINQELIDLIEANMPKHTLKFNDFYYNNQIAGIKLRTDSTRDAYQIPTEEYQDGIITIVKENSGITVDGCFKTLVSAIGFSKLLATTRKILEGVLNDLIIDKTIINKNGSLYINKE